MLEELHGTHPGMVHMKSLDHTHVWWPDIDNQIEQLVHDCDACQSVHNLPPTAVLHLWTWPDALWKRIHVDFAGPFIGSRFMVVINVHSKWLEVIPMATTTTTDKTLDALCSLFAAYGLPQQLVTDNQFTFTEFRECMGNLTHRVHLMPYHPATNGAVEHFIQTFKRVMKTANKDPGTIAQKLACFLLVYQTTQHATTCVTPPDLFLKQSLRTHLDLLPPSVQSHVVTQQLDQKYFYYMVVSREIFMLAKVRNLREGPKWLHGTVVEKSGPVSYRVEVQGQVCSRHSDQLLSYKGILDRSTVVSSDLCPEVTYELPATDSTESPQESIHSPNHSMVLS